jgi:ABC-type multidrug transport system ATPase subunit
MFVGVSDRGRGHPGTLSRSAAAARFLLAAESITVRRGRASLVSQFDVTLTAGEVVHVRGANGAGKTSLLRVLCGLSEPAAGVVRRNAARAFVPEKVALAPQMTAQEWLDAMRRLRALAPVDWTSHAVASGLEPAALHKPSSALSHGMLQRMALMEALASEAPLLFLDEPFSGLDEAGRIWLADSLCDRAEAGACVLLTDHGGVAAERLQPSRSLVIHDRQCRVVVVAAAESAQRRRPARQEVTVRWRSPTGVVSEAALPSNGVDDHLRALLAAGDHIIEVRP